MQIVVATHNEGKLVEIRRILEEDLGADAENIELVSAGSLHLPDPVETGVTFQENALLKARAVAIRTGLPAVADDSGLIVDVMGNAPGILSARWAGAHGHDKANNALLLAQIEDIPDDNRTRLRLLSTLLPLRRRAGGPGHRDRCRRDRWSGCRRHHRSHHGCRWEPCPGACPIRHQVGDSGARRHAGSNHPRGSWRTRFRLRSAVCPGRSACRSRQH